MSNQDALTSKTVADQLSEALALLISRRTYNDGGSRRSTILTNNVDDAIDAALRRAIDVLSVPPSAVPTFDEWQRKHGPNGGAYDIEMQRSGWEGAMDAAKVERERLRMALKTVGDDYPGSSCQKWCYEQAGLPLTKEEARE